MRQFRIPLLVGTFASGLLVMPFMQAGGGGGAAVALWLTALPALVAWFRSQEKGRAFLVVGALSCLAYLFEASSIATGFPYGPFTYGTGLGGLLADVVPWLVPVAWVPQVLAAAALVRITVRDLRLQAIMVALALTLFDFVLDPPAATLLGFWNWPEGGFWYGVPWSNFLGWMLTGYVAGVLSSLAARPVPRYGMLTLECATVFWLAVAIRAEFWLTLVPGVLLLIWLSWANARTRYAG